MMDKELVLSARGTLVDEIRRELMGPGSEYSIPDCEHEMITDLPEIRYSVGVLFPQKNQINADNNEIPAVTGSGDVEEIDDNLQFQDDIEYDGSKKTYSGSDADDIDVSTLDEDIGLSAQNKPSSMGFTFFIREKAEKLTFDVSFGTYRNSLVEDCRLPFTPENPDEYILPDVVSHLVEYLSKQRLLIIKSKFTRKDVLRICESEDMTDRYLVDCLYRLCNQFERGFVREPHKVPVEVTFGAGNYAEVNNLDDRNIKIVVLQKETIDSMHAVTAMLVNTETGAYNGRNSVFQPKIEISTIKNSYVLFETYSNREYGRENDVEEKTLELLYRDKKIFATGHGVSVDWSVNEGGKGSIWTEFIPSSVVPQMEFDIKDKSVNRNALSMKYLSDLDKTNKEEKIHSMKTLLNAYSNWISDIKIAGDGLDIRYKNTIDRHIKDCRESCERMYYGLRLLESDDIAYTSFELANRAMFMQRVHSMLQKKDSYPDDLNLQEKMAKLNYYDLDDEDRRWRPFQIAFLLMSIRSIVESDCSERDLVDLIWFPTGGGKTEAYLGLTAFTIFYRRIAYPKNSGGTTVIMRYTLRLLAAQQFLRAGTLICACESIRKDCERKSKYPVYPLGKEKITIGLWIGGTHTPNKNDDAKRFLNKLYKATADDLREVKDKNNKFQILKCPWCGTKLVIDLDATNKKLAGQWGYFMKDKNHFRIRCTQENCEFEHTLPIQIIDEELYDNAPTLLFGTVDKFAMLPWKNDVGSFFATSTENRTPELIIQDELHLISGPLGTIVGLYETAIDALCSTKGVKPKIIASTATIRRAKEQCSRLYNREVRQFPSSGIDAGDSFFACEADITKKPGRLYVGVMPSGKTKAMMEVRMIAAILQRVHMMDIPYEVKDKFWTLAVYFNSLRDLGKCMTLVDDDVKDFIRRTAQRFGMRSGVRQIGSADELTSRVSTSQLNETLEKLDLLEYSQANQAAKKYPINVLLATNMISVGVDVARLNVMLLVGQPKLTSEYIQASSRIGRTYPGVAFVLYDGAKSRDRSHYEQFRAYHESFYRFVEPTGVTPFSKPARDRALHAVMISFIRHMYGISRDSEAALFDKDTLETGEIEKYILERISEINNRSDFSLTDESEEILDEMRKFWAEWHERAEISERKNFYFGDRYIVSVPPADGKRLIKAFGNEGSDTAKETLTSMRNVDTSVTAGMIIWGD